MIIKSKLNDEENTIPERRQNVLKLHKTNQYLYNYVLISIYNFSIKC